MVTLGVLLSTLTHKTITSMTMCLLAWVVFTLAIPKISPMIARVVCPTESQEVISMRKKMTLEEIDKEYVRKGTEVYAKYNTLTDEVIDGYFAFKRFFKEQPALKTKYGVVEPLDKELFALDQERQNRIGHEIRQLDQAYAIAKNRQNAVAMGLSRLSPVSCYAYVVSALANTGVREFEKLAENARRYQEAVSDMVYEKYQTVFYKRGAMTGTRTVGLGEVKEIPEMRYEYMSLAEALAASWGDLLFLVAFNFIFLVLAFVSFNRYDVR
jgi:ABC-type transport system involved in multi-copper enzyme maturation permease subunit